MASADLYPPPPAPRTPRPEVLVIYHGHCVDGFTAAWAAWRVFGDTAEYLPADHASRPRPDVRGRRVYILDFSFPREQLIEMAREAASLVVIDHHQTAAHDLEGLPGMHFDLERCGAELAWEYFHPGKPLPFFIRHIADRDLAGFQTPECRAFLCWLERFPRTFENWERLARMSDAAYLRILRIGARRELDLDAQADALARTATPIELCGHRGLAVRCPQHLVCKVGPRLAEACGGIGLCWTPLSDALARVSLRGVVNIDLGAIARHFGGGGHPFAAGFVLKREALDALLGGTANRAS